MNDILDPNAWIAQFQSALSHVGPLWDQSPLICVTLGALLVFYLVLRIVRRVRMSRRLAALRTEVASLQSAATGAASTHARELQALKDKHAREIGTEREMHRNEMAGRTPQTVGTPHVTVAPVRPGLNGALTTVTRLSQTARRSLDAAITALASSDVGQAGRNCSDASQALTQLESSLATAA